MFDFIRWNKMKLDAAPGTLVYAGESRDFDPSVTRYAYNADGVDEAKFKGGEVPLLDGKINLLVATGIHQPEVINQIGTSLGVPPIFLEDVLNTGQRAKFSWADDTTAFLVLKSMHPNEGGMDYQQVSLFWRDDMVVVFLEQESDLLEGVVNRIRKGKGRIRRSDGAYLMVAVLDALVDNHMHALGVVSEDAQILENKLESTVSDELLGELYSLKREMIIARNTLIPVRDIFKALLREDAEITNDALPYLHDTAGHNEQTLEAFSSLHDILKSMIDYQISLIGIRTNKVMQFLTVIATIFIPLTFIAGVYGMNFTNMPELKWEYGYHAVWVIMGVVGVGMYLYFRRKRFL